MLDFSLYRQQSIDLLSETTTRVVPAVPKKTVRRQACYAKSSRPLKRRSSDRQGRQRRPVLACIAATPGWRRGAGTGPTHSSCARSPAYARQANGTTGPRAGLVPIAGVSCILACAQLAASRQARTRKLPLVPVADQGDWRTETSSYDLRSCQNIRISRFTSSICVRASGTSRSRRYGS